MNRKSEEIKEKQISKDIVSAENIIRHAYNQGYEQGLRASKQEPCEDAISRKDVENIVNKYIDGSFQWGAMLVEIMRLPSVKPAERVGRWVGIEYDGYADGNPVYDVWECSECKDEHYGDDGTLTPYCQNCGARMEGGNEEE